MTHNNYITRYILIALAVVVVLIGVWLVLRINPQKNKENYDILGGLAPYKAGIVKCMDDCEHQDPSNRLGPGNSRCYQKCNAIYTEAARRNVPVIPQKTNIEKCRDDCKHPDPEVEDKCINMCSCRRDVADYCAVLKCPYSSLPKDECMRACVDRESVNCDRLSGWTWKTIS